MPFTDWLQLMYTFSATEKTTAEVIIQDFLRFNTGSHSQALQELLSVTPFPHCGSMTACPWRKNA